VTGRGVANPNDESTDVVQPSDRP